MLSLLFLLLTFPFCHADTEYAVDFVGPATADQLNCLFNSKYYSMIPRVSRPDGEVDYNGINTILIDNTLRTRLGAYGFITPNVGLMDGSLQVDKLHNALISNGIGYLHCYIQVTRSSAPWSNNPSANLALINSIINRGSQLGHYYMILTSFSDWVSITGNSKTIARAYMGQTFLWYSNVHGPGVTGESPPSYSDFVAFGPWTSRNITMKQFATSEVVCGLNVNRNVYFEVYS